MGRGRHKSSRGRDSDSEWAGEHGGAGWHDDERGTQEWLNDGNGPGWLDDPEPDEPSRPRHDPPDSGRHVENQDVLGRAEAPGVREPMRRPPYPSAWDTGSPSPARPAWPNAWDDPAPAPTGHADPTAWDPGTAVSGPQPVRDSGTAVSGPQGRSAWDSGTAVSGPQSVWESGTAVQGSRGQAGFPGSDPQTAFPATGPQPGRSGALGGAEGAEGFPSTESPAEGTRGLSGPALDGQDGFPGSGRALDREDGFLGSGRALDREDGFLGSGGGADPEADSFDLSPEKGRRRQRANRPRLWRGRRLMVLSAVAVVAAIGSAVIGIKLSSNQLDLTRTPDCPKGEACAAIAPAKPPADTASAGPADTDDPTASGSPRASKPARPTASRTPAPRTPVASARPTPDRTRATPTPKPSRTPRNTPEPTPTPDETDTAFPEETSPADETDPIVSPGRVDIDFGVSGVTNTGYTGELTVTNRGLTLDEWSVRVPVGGSVTGADGAEWTQEGDTLVLSSTAPLGENDQVVISFVATGESAQPDSCELNGGSCQLSVSEDTTLQSVF
ncbi:hypothetical protein [Sphaerisporangium flaviroseum]